MLLAQNQFIAALWWIIKVDKVGRALILKHYSHHNRSLVIVSGSKCCQGIIDSVGTGTFARKPKFAKNIAGVKVDA